MNLSKKKKAVIPFLFVYTVSKLVSSLNLYTRYVYLTVLSIKINQVLIIVGKNTLLLVT